MNKPKTPNATTLSRLTQLLMLASWLLLSGCDLSPPPEYPEYAKMRAHIVNILSDEQIRSLHIEAEKELQAIRDSRKKVEEDLWEERATNSARCKDIAFSTKHPGACNVPFSLPESDFGYESVESIFERKLMGKCDSAITVREAKKFGCLP